MKKILSLLLISAVQLVFAADANEPYAPTRVEPKINVTVKENANVVHFVRDNTDPDVISKVYTLKHVDAYELRRYLREMVQSRKVDASNTGVTALSYADGTQCLIISAEDYRFDDSPHGEGFDSLIQKLDQPGVISQTGQKTYVYLPKYRRAKTLEYALRQVGANVEDDPTETLGGSDRLVCDEEQNVLFLKTAPFSQPHIEKLLQTYDVAFPEAVADISIYELTAENDAQIGLDFQNWKNNDGVDFFSAAGRFRKNADAVGNEVNSIPYSRSQTFGFNPKWNTRFIDFLATSGKAKTLHNVKIQLRHGKTSCIEKTNSAFYVQSEALNNAFVTQESLFVPEGVFLNAVPQGRTTSTGWTAQNVFILNALTPAGKAIYIKDAAERSGPLLTLKILHLANNANAQYHLELEGGTFVVDGTNRGNKIIAAYAEVYAYTAEDDLLGFYTWTGETMPFATSGNMDLLKGNATSTQAADVYGFKMDITPNITERAILLDLNFSNSSLIGYTSDGTPRISRNAALSTRFTLPDSSGELIIGGLTNSHLVSCQNGIPILKDIPLIGYLFSTKSESLKQSKLVVTVKITREKIPEPNKEK